MRLDRHLVLIAALFALATPAPAATFLVTSTADAGPGSLRQALIDAGSDTTYPRRIVFDAAYPQGGVITLQSPLPTWSNHFLEIDGGDRQPVIDGDNARRVLSFSTDSREVKLRGLTLRRGRTTAGAGGCLWLAPGPTTTDLYVFNSRFEQCVALGNQASAYGGAISWASSDAVVFIHDSQFTGNAVGVLGNASLKEGFGGAIQIRARRIELLRTRFTGNSVERIGGTVQALGGAAHLGASYRVNARDIEFRDNAVIDADASAAGTISAGGAATLACEASDCGLYLINAGFVDNQISGQAIAGGALATSGAITLDNISFHGNQAPGGSGGALLAMTGSIDARHLSFLDNGAAFGAHLATSGIDIDRWAWSLVGASSAGSGSACDLSASSLTGTLSANLFAQDCGLLSASGGVIGPVGALTLDSGTFPASLVPGAGSPAIDPALPLGDCYTHHDALGTPRPQDGDADGVARCDIGAVEVRPAAVFSDSFEGNP